MMGERRKEGKTRKKESRKKQYFQTGSSSNSFIFRGPSSHYLE
jgi:hypothetical protein